MKQILFFALLFPLFVALHGDPADPSKVDSDYAKQGEYSGVVEGEEGDLKVGCQVVAMGKGEFMARGYIGGLPGDGWNRIKEEKVNSQKKEDGSLVFENDKHRAVLKGGIISVETLDGKKMGVLKKIMRKSPTLGAKPPKGSIVLFEGSSTENFKPGRMTEDHLLMEGAKSIKLFRDHRLHIEFRLPYKPTARGQGRGNSGLYLQGRYEVQMLDSFGLDGKNNECGGVYGIAPPRENMCFPPLTWQTYDVDFRAAIIKDGKKLKNAKMTVRHNGVIIHDELELPKRTTASPLKEGPEPGFIYLQNHGNPVRYRNIWVKPL
jgi:hypothetical protein